MRVVIKAFSRPFYLDRCLASLRANVDGAAGIVVLDDGLLAEAVARLARRYPEVEFVRSRWADTKPSVVRAMLRHGKAMEQSGPDVPPELRKAVDMIFRGLGMPPEMDPLRFWWPEIDRLDDEFIFLIEEDCWIPTHLDLAAIEAAMRAHGTAVTHAFLHNKKRFLAVTHAADVGEATSFETVTVPDPPDEQAADTYFPVSLAIYHRAYWLDSHAGIGSFIPEGPIHAQALAALARRRAAGEPSSFARLVPEPVRHGFSLSSLVPPSHYGAPISLYDVSDVLTNAWMEGRLDPMADFPGDFGEERLARLVVEGLGIDAARMWLEFRRTFANYYQFLNKSND